MNHLEFAALESAMLKPDPCERWLDKVEELAGHDLDGDQCRDGYSLDDCVEMFNAGCSPESAATAIAVNREAVRERGDACPDCAAPADPRLRDVRVRRAMVHFVMCELWSALAGLPAADAGALSAAGFTASDILRHEDAARYEARRRFNNARPT